MTFLLTEFRLTQEFVISMFGFLLSVGTFYGVTLVERKTTKKRLDKLENVQEEHGKILVDVVKSQAVNGEKLSNLNEKIDSVKDLIRDLFKGKIP